MARKLLRARHAVASLEFAIVALPLIVFILGLMEFTYDVYAQLALGTALSTSVRTIGTGNAQGSASSLATFKSAVFCPALGGLLDCSKVSLNVVPVPTFFSSTPRTYPTTNGSFDPSGFTYCPGQPSQLMMAQAVFPAPAFASQLFPSGLTSYGGQQVRIVWVTAGFVNEPFSATAAQPSGC